MSGKDRNKLLEVFLMCNNFCGGNFFWVIILAILFCGCGNNGMMQNNCGCGCDNNNNNCGCGCGC